MLMKALVLEIGPTIQTTLLCKPKNKNTRNISLVDDVYTNPPTQKEMHSLHSIESEILPERIITFFSEKLRLKTQCIYA